jgi:hypothetical protein
VERRHSGRTNKAASRRKDLSTSHKGGRHDRAGDHFRCPAALLGAADSKRRPRPSLNKTPAPGKCGAGANAKADARVPRANVAAASAGFQHPVDRRPPDLEGLRDFRSGEPAGPRPEKRAADALARQNLGRAPGERQPEARPPARGAHRYRSPSGKAPESISARGIVAIATGAQGAGTVQDFGTPHLATRTLWPALMSC